MPIVNAEVLTMKRICWRIRSLLWLVLIAGVILGIIRYYIRISGSHETGNARTRSSSPSETGTVSPQNMKLFIYRRGNPDRNCREK